MTYIELSITIGGILLAIVGYFLKSLHTDLKDVQQESINNKTEVQLLKLKQEQDRIHMEEITQAKLQMLTDNVNSLTTQVKQLVTLMLKNGISPD